MAESEGIENNGYGKRPMWQWVIFYLIIAGLLYGAGYYFFFSKNSAINYSSLTTISTNPTETVSSTALSQEDLFTTRTDTIKGDYFADTKGMALYTYDNDTSGVSNCYDGCAVAWPPYLVSTTPTTLPENVTIVNRTDGSMVYAWKGMPLYYFQKDTQAGDITGDGVGGVWHLVAP